MISGDTIRGVAFDLAVCGQDRATFTGETIIVAGIVIGVITGIVAEIEIHGDRAGLIELAAISGVVQDVLALMTAEMQQNVAVELHTEWLAKVPFFTQADGKKLAVELEFIAVRAPVPSRGTTAAHTVLRVRTVTDSQE